MAGLFQSVINCFQKPRECGLDSASLKKQDASTSAAIISLLEEDAEFVALSKFEGESIVGRDNEDAEKLQKGVDASIAKGVLPVLNPPPEYLTIDVLGKTPDAVCDIILDHMGSAATTGGVVVLCGLSGTGKGTTVARLEAALADEKTANNAKLRKYLPDFKFTPFEEAMDTTVKWFMENYDVPGAVRGAVPKA